MSNEQAQPMTGSALSRRAAIAAPWVHAARWLPALPFSGAALQGCRVDRSRAALEGGWLGAAHERGHVLRHAFAAPTAPAVQKRCTVAIVGGGVAGLAAARALLRAGVEDIALFELEDAAGGNARTHQMHGMACPQGAHYLPLPGDQATDVQELLFDLGLLRTAFGRTLADERHLCHSPQERLWVEGQWVEGLLPPAASGSARQTQYRRFAKAMTKLSRELAFAIPTHKAPWTAGHAALDGIPFARWLGEQGFDDPGLRWYLDYACRDDYGADSEAVSAWAGVHYFASRHGFHVPGDDEKEEREAVFTWPEGNAWLTQRLAPALGSRLRRAALVHRVEVMRHGVQLDVLQFEGATGGSAQGAAASTARGSAHTARKTAQDAPLPAHAATLERWTSQHVVLALPLHAAVRILGTPPSALARAAAQVPQAPWLVANLHLRAPLTDKPGAPPSWDNVLYPFSAAAASSGAAGLAEPPSNNAHSPATGALGYVDAMHQNLRPMAGPTVLTAYWALGHAQPQLMHQQRQALLNEPWQAWAQRVLNDLSRAHPDLQARTARVDLTRYGHAMAVPVPGVRGSAALRALAEPAAPRTRLHFAHSDLAAYSVFEEAYTRGTAVGQQVSRRLAG
jgi:monoamine oxidase